MTSFWGHFLGPLGRALFEPPRHVIALTMPKYGGPDSTSDPRGSQKWSKRGQKVTPKEGHFRVTEVVQNGPKKGPKKGPKSAKTESVTLGHFLGSLWGSLFGHFLDPFFVPVVHPSE